MIRMAGERASPLSREACVCSELAAAEHGPSPSAALGMIAVVDSGSQHGPIRVPPDYTAPPKVRCWILRLPRSVVLRPHAATPFG